MEPAGPRPPTWKGLPSQEVGGEGMEWGARAWALLWLTGPLQAACQVLPGQVCFIFPTPCQKHPAFASVLSTRSNSSQVSAELHMPDFALGAPTATISFKEPSIPGSAHDSFCPTLLRLSLRGVKPLTQGHTASSGRAPPIPVHVQWGCVASLEHTLGLCWNFPCMSK